MKYFVYILISDKGRYYIGYTCSLERRINEHNRGNSKATSRMGELKLLGYFQFLNKKDAMDFERKIKVSGHTERFINHVDFINI